MKHHRFRESLTPAIRQRIHQHKATFGDYGSAIPGSHLIRWYCNGCGEPMRVARAREPTEEMCGQCDGHIANLGGHAGNIDDITGYQANAIRAMEGD